MSQSERIPHDGAHIERDSYTKTSTIPLNEQQILDQWTPKPLTPKIDEEKYKSVLNPRVLSSRPGKYICVDGKKCLNLATNDFLGLSCHKSLDKAALDGKLRRSTIN